ncbi:SAM-dependent chlorinase/fluorinase [Saccharothrix sp. AJ9571]|nr:SAM-dependent chlorinase/fluorinase [Saccharothrix sp. AJ9571]
MPRTAYDWISFTTDYGLDDGFVAACRGVIAQRATLVRVLDVSHAIPPQHVRHGSAVLAQTVPYLPEAVHLAVVDPGVGTSRLGVVVVTDRGLLVGPDNGLLLPAAEALGGVRAAYQLTEPRYRLRQVSATFHGRDIFAPAAAHLALGADPADFGEPVSDLVRLPDPKVLARPGQLVSEVLTVDRFGNVQLAATALDLDLAELSGFLVVRCGAHELVVSRGRTFADLPPGEGVLFTDSAEQLAVAVNGGSAAASLGLHPAWSARGTTPAPPNYSGGSASQVCTVTASPTAS